MAKTYSFGATRRWSLGHPAKPYDITIEIDVDDLIYWLGDRASKNKGGVAYHLHKAVKVTAKEVT